MATKPSSRISMETPKARRARAITAAASGGSGGSAGSVSSGDGALMSSNTDDEMEWDLLVGAGEAGGRLDAVLAAGLEQFSRSRVKDLILHGAVLVNGQAVT